jgi:hypothetical protein
MTEAEWLACTDPLPLFDYLRRQARARRAALPQRRFRLFGCACCRLAWPLLADESCRAAVEVSERFADGLAKKSELGRACRAAGGAAEALKPAGGTDGPAGRRRQAVHLAAEMALWVSSDSIHDVVEMVSLTAEKLAASAAEVRTAPGRKAVAGGDPLRRLGDLMRDVFGNPFRLPQAVDPAWLAWNRGTVARLAQAAYEERDPATGTLDAARLAVLADAVEEAGCTDAELLAHLRSPGPHVRGCRSLDAVLGRS